MNILALTTILFVMTCTENIVLQTDAYAMGREHRPNGMCKPVGRNEENNRSEYTYLVKILFSFLCMKM